MVEWSDEKPPSGMFTSWLTWRGWSFKMSMHKQRKNRRQMHISFYMERWKFRVIYFNLKRNISHHSGEGDVPMRSVCLLRSCASEGQSHHFKATILPFSNSESERTALEIAGIFKRSVFPIRQKTTLYHLLLFKRQLFHKTALLPWKESKEWGWKNNFEITLPSQRRASASALSCRNSTSCSNSVPLRRRVQRSFMTFLWYSCKGLWSSHNPVYWCQRSTFASTGIKQFWQPTRFCQQ